MSSSNSSTPTSDQVAQYLEQFNFTGGYPRSSDLAPSIVFIILYVLLLPLLIFRWVRRSSRTMTLIRPTLFILVRVATFIIRAIMSKQTATAKDNSVSNINELIAELVLVSIGFLFIISPIISLWKKHIESEVAKSEQPKWLKSWVKLGHLVLIGAIITAVVGSSIMGSASPSSVKTLRQVSYILSLAVVVVTLFGVVRTHFHLRLRTRPTMILVAVSLICLIVGVYRVCQLFSTDPSGPARSQAAFYVLQVTMEFIAVSILIAVNLNVWFPGQPKAIDTPSGDALELPSNKRETGHYSNV